MLAQVKVVRSPEQGERGKVESWSLYLSAALLRYPRVIKYILTNVFLTVKNDYDSPECF